MRAHAIGLEFECEVTPGYAATWSEPGEGILCQDYRVAGIDSESEFREVFGERFGSDEAEFAVRVFQRTGKFPEYTLAQVEDWDREIRRSAERQYR